MHVWIQRGLKALTVCTALLLQQAAVAQDVAPKVVFQTTQGNFTVEVYPDKSPKTVENFLRYVKDKHYNGTVFHRVIPNFMVQTGGYDAKLKQRPTKPPIPLESGNGLLNQGTGQLFVELAGLG